MKKIFTVKSSAILLMLLLVLFLVVLNFSGAAQTPKPIELKIGHGDPPNNFTTLNITVPWTESMEKATNGRIKFIHYPSSSLFPANETLTAIETGITDVSWSPISSFPGRFSLTEVMFLPFLASKPDSGIYTRVVNELYDTVPEIQQEFSTVKLLYLCSLEPYCVCTAKKPVHKLEDLKGLKIRVSGRIASKIVEKLGASPVNISLADVYDAAAKGVIDGALLSTDMIVAFQLHQVFPYVTRAPLWASVEFWAMNKDRWESFPKDMQEQIMSVNGMTAALTESTNRYGQKFQDEFEAMQKKDGKEITWYTLPPDEVSRWREIAGPPIWEEWVAEVGAKGLPARKVLDKALELFREYEQ